MEQEYVTLMVVEPPDGGCYLVECPQDPNIVPGLLAAVSDLIGTIQHCLHCGKGSPVYRMVCALGGLPMQATEIYKPMPMAK